MVWRVNRGARGVGADAMKEMVRLLDQANSQFSAREKAEGVGKLPSISDHYVAARAVGTGIRTHCDK